MTSKRANVFVVPGEPNSDWLQLSADAFARMKRLLGWEVNLFLPAGELAHAANIRFAAESFAGPEAVVSYLMARLQQAGAVYERPGQFPICKNCGLPAFPSQKCECDDGVHLAERGGCYFRIGRYRQGCIDHLAQTSIVLPANQRNHVIELSQGMPTDDVLIALKTTGAQKTFQPTQWLSNLAAILSTAGYPRDEGGYLKLWSNTYFFVPRAKISFVHFWCSLLAALKLPPPGGFVCHNDIEIRDRRQQMVNPLLLARNYGADSIRFFFLAARTQAGENTFTEDQVVQRLNHDLASELGGLNTRVTAMVMQYAGEMVPRPNILTRQNSDLELREQALAAPEKVEGFLLAQELPQAIHSVKNLIWAADKFIALSTPHRLAQDGSQQERLSTVLYNICEAMRFIAILLKPIMPGIAQSILVQLGIDQIPSLTAWAATGRWGLLPVDTKILPQPVLFPRIVPGFGGSEQDLILREELARINMVVARILSVEGVPDYEGLLRLILYDGSQRYSVLAPITRPVSGLALEGKKVVLLANLKPTEVEGMQSEGEVLVVEAGVGRPELVFVGTEVPEGSKVLCLS